jgi:nucleoside-diphosphate kinase
MVISSWFGAVGAIGENAPYSRVAFDRLKPMPGSLNGAGTAVSGSVHVREIVEAGRAIADRAQAGSFAGSLAVRGRRRYKRGNSQQRFFKDEVMAIERTFSIIKPDATARNLTGAVNALIEKAGLRIVAQKRIRMTRAQAETFYAVHKARPFFGELVEFMISAPVVVQVLEGENAVLRHRDVMGATDPSKAADGTIRKLHARSIGENSVHGSDAAETAAVEIAQFFSGNEIVG